VDNITTLLKPEAGRFPVTDSTDGRYLPRHNHPMKRRNWLLLRFRSSTSPKKLNFWATLSLLMLFITACQQDAPDSLTEQIILPPPLPVPANQIVTLLPPDSIQAIDEPQFETAVQANTHLRPQEKVIGVLINGEARAYPIPILSVHEIVNDTIGGAAWSANQSVPF